jgi:putative transposase
VQVEPKTVEERKQLVQGNRMAYPSDLSDAQWELLEPLISPEKPGGRKRRVDIRAVCNGIFYHLKTGCQWRMLPRDYPPYSTVYFYYRSWQVDGSWERINQALVRESRIRAGKHPLPSVMAVDSQSVKTSEKGGRSVVLMEARR